jgi:hypothetical protein
MTQRKMNGTLSPSLSNEFSKKKYIDSQATSKCFTGRALNSFSFDPFAIIMK